MRGKSPLTDQWRDHELPCADWSRESRAHKFQNRFEFYISIQILFELFTGLVFLFRYSAILNLFLNAIMYC